MSVCRVKDTFLTIVDPADEQSDEEEAQPFVKRNSTTTDLRKYREEGSTIPEYVEIGKVWRKIKTPEDLLTCRSQGRHLSIGLSMVSEASTEGGANPACVDSPISWYGDDQLAQDGDATDDQQGTDQADAQDEEEPSAKFKCLSLDSGFRALAEADGKPRKPCVRRSWTSCTEDSEGPWGPLTPLMEDTAKCDALVDIGAETASEDGQQGTDQADAEDDDEPSAKVKCLSLDSGLRTLAEADGKPRKPYVRRSWTSCTEDSEGPWGPLTPLMEDTAKCDGFLGTGAETPPEALATPPASPTPKAWSPPRPQRQQAPARPRQERERRRQERQPKVRPQPEGREVPDSGSAEATGTMDSWLSMQPTLMMAAMAQANGMAGFGLPPMIPGGCLPGAWPPAPPFAPWPAAAPAPAAVPAAASSPRRRAAAAAGQPAAVGAAAAAKPQAAGTPEGETTVMMRNLPNNYTRSMVLDLLNEHKFSGKYDFVYVPHDFQTSAGLGFAFINLVDHATALDFKEHFQGFRNWVLPSAKVCAVGWSGPEQQGLAANIERYRNSSVMHESVAEDAKPILFRNGKPVPFPRNTRKLWPPHASHGARAKKS